MKILIVCPDFPFPPNHGGRVDVWSRIKVFSLLGYEIHLIVTDRIRGHERFLGAVSEHVRSITWVPRKWPLSFFLGRKPYQVASRRDLGKLRYEKSIDVLWLETEAVAEVLSSEAKAGITVLRSHNNESKYFSALAKSEKTWWRRAYYAVESFLYRGYTSSVKAKCDRIAHISKDEYEGDLADLKLRNKCIFLPSHVDKRGFVPPRQASGTTVLFVGNLFMPNNLAGLWWYLRNVDPLVTKAVKNYTFIIAGNTRGADVSALKHAEHVVLVDSPQDLSPIYRQAAVFVNPMLAGAGVKLKTINAIESGLPVVSTTIGIEGIGLTPDREFALADDPEVFASRVIELLLNEDKALDMATKAQAYLAANFDAVNIISRLLTNP